MALLKGIYRAPQRDLWGLGFRAYLKGLRGLVRVPKGLLKEIYRAPQRDLWGLGFRAYLEGQGT